MATFSAVDTNVGVVSMGGVTELELCRINVVNGVVTSSLLPSAWSGQIQDQLVNKLLVWTTETERRDPAFLRVLIGVADPSGKPTASFRYTTDSATGLQVVSLITANSNDVVLLYIPRTSEAGYLLPWSGSASADSADAEARAAISNLTNQLATLTGVVNTKANTTAIKTYTAASDGGLSLSSSNAFAVDGTVAKLSAVPAVEDEGKVLAVANRRYALKTLPDATTFATVAALDALSDRVDALPTGGGTTSVTAAGTAVSGLSVAVTPNGSGGVSVGLTGTLTGFSPSGHTHDYLTKSQGDDLYASKDSVPAGAISSVTASSDTVRGLGLSATPSGSTVSLALTGDITGFADAGHTHTGYVSSADLEALESLVTDPVTGLSSKAPIGHTHTGYAPTDHTHTGYAPTDHTHTGYADAGHTHTEYSAIGHTHTEYADAGHNHDARYYTETEADDRFVTQEMATGLQAQINGLTGNVPAEDATLTQRVIALEAAVESIPLSPAINPDDYVTRASLTTALQGYMAAGSLDEFLTESDAALTYATIAALNDLANSLAGEGEPPPAIDPLAYVTPTQLADYGYIAKSDTRLSNEATAEDLVITSDLDEYALQADLDAKADVADLAGKADVTALDSKADASTVYTRDYIDGAFVTNLAPYAKTMDVNARFNSYTPSADLPTYYYTKDAADAKFALISSTGGGGGSTQDLRLQRRLADPVGTPVTASSGGSTQQGVYHVTLTGRGGDLSAITVARDTALETGNTDIFGLSITNTSGTGLESISIATYGTTMAQVVLVMDNPQGSVKPHEFVRPLVMRAGDTGAPSVSGTVQIAGSTGAAVTTVDQNTAYPKVRISVSGLNKVGANGINDPGYNKVQYVTVQL